MSLALTREEILALYAQGPEAVVALVTTLLARLSALEQDVAALKAAQAKDSHNSGKPPSSDVTRTGRVPKSLRGPSGQRPGGQPGHPGTTLALRAMPDAVVVHAPTHCGTCGQPVAAAAPSTAPLPGERRQVFELPALGLVCTEHRVVECACTHCGAWTRGAFPPEARTTVQYGPRVLALGVSLTAQHLVPVARAAEILTALTAHRVSPATLLAAEQRVARRVAPVVTHIRTGLAHAPVLHVDETGFFAATVAHWLHVACTPTLTAYHAHRSRGRVAFAAGGILPTFTGTLVHDGYESYREPTYACRHALCGVHLLRELTFLAEETGATWAAAVKTALLTMKRATDHARAAGRVALARATVRRHERRYDALLAAGEAAEPPPTHRAGTRGRLARSPGGKLLFRLRRDRAAVLCFLHDLTVPFDNSAAERDLRMMKVEQKVSGGFRTLAGAETFCTLRSYLVTARKQGLAAVDVLHAALLDLPYWPALP